MKDDAEQNIGVLAAILLALVICIIVFIFIILPALLGLKW